MKERRFRRGAVNHVYQRTFNRFNIFYDLADFLVYYTIFCTFARQADIVVWGLCIMIDHIHSLIQADSLKTLSEFMSRTTSVFARVYNKERRRHGPLFEERFGSAPKADLKRLISSIIYLANNPVERRICTKAEEYRWNFIAYIDSDHPFSEKFHVKDLSKILKRALRCVDWHARQGNYLTYSVIDSLYQRLQGREKDILTDYVISRYNVIDYERVMQHFDSYDRLLTAIHSTTGSEYDLNEDKDRFSDGVYRDFIRIVKQSGIEHIRSVMMLDDDTKFDIARKLLCAPDSHLRQIYKFLHIVPADINSD